MNDFRLVTASFLDTRITKAKVNRRARKASFRFAALGGLRPLHFECQLDTRPV